MEIDNNLIRKLERLSRLSLSDPAREKLKGELSDILKMIDKLGELDTKGVEPLVYLSQQSQILRADNVGNQLSTEQALSNAPESGDKYFLVPKIIKK